MSETDDTVISEPHARGDEIVVPATRFEVGDELGRGGMGRVVAAKDRALGREVAIKHALSTEPEDIARFEREIRITALLEHPAIVPIHETGHDERGQPYYVMRRIEGEPLSQHIATASDTRARLALIPRLLAAVDAAAFAHARGIIHRDIKPSNILLGAYGETLLIDWGLARSLTEKDADTTRAGEIDSDVTQAGAVIGTPGYMSPEQARGDQLDARTDVFALGATLYHVLAGRAPFADRRIEERIALAVLGQSPDREALDPEIPAELIAIVDKTLAPLDERYRDAGELARDLRAFLNGQLVGAHRYTARERFARFVRRHRVAVAATAIATIAVVAVGVFAIINVVRERDLAEDARLEAVEQRRVADERADQMLLDRASAIASTDSTRALLLLRDLQAGSPQTRRARDIAEVAASRGISIGSTVHEGMVLSMEIHPDGRQLLSSGVDGRIAIHDLIHGGGRVLSRWPKRVQAAIWTQAGTSITATPGDRTLVVLDPSSAAIRRVLDPAADIQHLWPIEDGRRVRYLDDTTKQLREVALDGEPHVLVERAVQVGVDGDHAIVLGPDHTTVIEGEVRRKLDLAFTPSLQVVVDRHRRRFAVLTSEHVEEHTYDGELIHRYPVRQRPFRGGYVGDRLYVSNGEGMIFWLRPTETREMGRAEPSVSWVGRTKTGLAFAFANGTVSVIDAAGLHHVVMDHQVRVLATSTRSMIVATGSSSGEITWKDLSRVQPDPIPSGAQTACHLESDRLYVLSDTRLIEIDRATHAHRVVYESRVPLSHCLGRVGNSLLVAAINQTTVLVSLVDPKAIPIASGLLAKGPARTVLFVRGREVIELDEETGTERVRWTAPGAISILAATGPRVVLAAGKRVVALEGSVVIDQFELPQEPFALGIMANDEIWYAIGSTVYARTSTGTRALHTFPQPLLAWQQENTTEAGILLVDRSAWHLTARGAINRVRGAVSRPTSFGPGVVAVKTSPTMLQVIYLASGEQIVRDVFRTVTSFRAMNDGQLVIGYDHSYFVIYEPLVPHDLVAYRSWLDRVTNAKLEAGVLVWR